MSWKDWFRPSKPPELRPADSPPPEPPPLEPTQTGDAEPTGSSTPIRGFTVLRIDYPNHLRPEAKPLTNYDIAIRLSYDMDVEWFANDHELEHFATTMPVQGNDENQDAFGFDFGPVDPETETDDFIEHFTVIVRETAGGGFMLLVQDAAIAYGDKIRELFDAVVADRGRENPDLSGDDAEPAT
jgi:hypothetical protein